MASLWSVLAECPWRGSVGTANLPFLDPSPIVVSHSAPDKFHCFHYPRWLSAINGPLILLSLLNFTLVQHGPASIWLNGESGGCWSTALRATFGGVSNTAFAFSSPSWQFMWLWTMWTMVLQELSGRIPRCKMVQNKLTAEIFQLTASDLENPGECSCLAGADICIGLAFQKSCCGVAKSVENI